MIREVNDRENDWNLLTIEELYDRMKPRKSLLLVKMDSR